VKIFFSCLGTLITLVNEDKIKKKCLEKINFFSFEAFLMTLEGLKSFQNSGFFTLDWREYDNKLEFKKKTGGMLC